MKKRLRNRLEEGAQELSTDEVVKVIEQGRNAEKRFAKGRLRQYVEEFRLMFSLLKDY